MNRRLAPGAFNFTIALSFTTALRYPRSLCSRSHSAERGTTSAPRRGQAGIHSQ